MSILTEEEITTLTQALDGFMQKSQALFDPENQEVENYEAEKNQMLETLKNNPSNALPALQASLGETIERYKNSWETLLQATGGAMLTLAKAQQQEIKVNDFIQSGENLVRTLNQISKKHPTTPPATTTPATTPPAKTDQGILNAISETISSFINWVQEKWSNLFSAKKTDTKHKRPGMK